MAFMIDSAGSAVPDLNDTATQTSFANVQMAINDYAKHFGIALPNPVDVDGTIGLKTLAGAQVCWNDYSQHGFISPQIVTAAGVPAQLGYPSDVNTLATLADYYTAAFEGATQTSLTVPAPTETAPASQPTAPAPTDTTAATPADAETITITKLPSGGHRVWPWVVGSVIVAGGATALGFWLRSRSKRQRLRTALQGDDRYESEYGDDDEDYSSDHDE